MAATTDLGVRGTGRHARPAVVAEDAPARRLRPDIQALRALAVSTVLVFHLWPGLLGGGYVGVDVFFVISGFLITGALLREAEARGRVSVLGFWSRRMRRLLPAALLVLGFTLVATVLWVPQHLWEQYGRQLVASTLYVENWVLASDSVDYMAAANRPTAVQHFWTLSVEEQFYVVLPLLLVGTLFAGGVRWRRIFGVVLVAGVAASFVWSDHLATTSPAEGYFATTTRVWEFGLGALLAFTGWRVGARLRPAAAWTGVGMICVAALVYSESTRFPGYAALLPVVGAVLVIAATHEDGRFGALVRRRPVQLVGDVSYAMYLWHWPLIVLLPFVLGRRLDDVDRLAIVAVTVLLAWASTRLLEDPIRFRLGRTAAGRRRVVAALAGGMAVIVVGGLALPAASDDVDVRELVALTRAADPACFGAGALSEDGCTQPVAFIPPTAFTGDESYSAGACWATGGVSEVRLCTLGKKRGAERRILFLGDSHALALLPAFAAIADSRDWRIDVAAKGGCPFSEALAPGLTPSQAVDCAEWNDGVHAVIESRRYDALVVTHREGHRRDEPIDVTTTDSVEVDGLVDAWTPHAADGLRIVALTDVPTYPTDVVECAVERELDADGPCGVERAEALPALPAAVAAAREVPGARVIDMSDAYCGPQRCSPVVGGVSVFHEPGHLSVPYAETIAPYLAPRLAAAVRGRTDPGAR